MKNKKTKHLGHGVFAFFIMLSFFGAVFFLENQGSWITGFAVSEVSADSPITATLGTGISLGFKWQGQEYSLRAAMISLGEGKVKLEVIKPSVPSATAAAATTSTPARTATTTTAKTSTPTTTSPTRTATTTTSPTTTSTRTTTTTSTTTRSSPATTTILAKCQDKIDNDKDGKIDYPADRGCTSLSDNDETDTITTSTTSTRTTTTTPTTTTARSTTTTTTSGSTVTGRATISTTTTRSPTTTTTSPTTTSTTAARSTDTATTSVSGTTAATSSSKKLGDFELLKTEEKGFDLDGDGSEDVSFTLLDVPSSRQAKIEIREITETEELPEELLGEGAEVEEETAGQIVYSNDLIEVNALLDVEGAISSYEVTYSFNEVGTRIPFSFPCDPEEKELGNIFTGINKQVKVVYSYDPIEGWLVWNPGTEAANNLDEEISEIFGEDASAVKFFYGFVVVLNEPVAFKISCMPSETENVALEAGWNLFALRGFEEKTLGEVIAKSANLGEANEFKGGKFQKAVKLKDLKLQPGKAYWANVKTKATLGNPSAGGGSE